MAGFWILASNSVYSQQEWRNWNSAVLNLSISKKLDMRFGHLRAYEMTNNFRSLYNQSGVSVSYALIKKLSITGGYILTTFPGREINVHRYYGRITHRLTIAKMINWNNSLQAEAHSSAETRYRNRFIYITRFSNKNRIDFLHITLSVAYWLYYNMGGNSIKYYDKTGNIIARHSPDGIHRGRLFLTANSKISKNFSLSLFYMNQQEFNLFSPEQRKINVTNPSTGKITRSFDHYNAVGISLLFDINLYHSK